ncbi:MAG: hypothetical protein ACI9OJ_005277 [Myxococcota bacterium]|jgi:hypothetical protein
MSNIHTRGTPPSTAARRLATMARAMIRQRSSGVSLDLSGLGGGEACGYRAPQVRKQLVEVDR